MHHGQWIFHVAHTVGYSTKGCIWVVLNKKRRYWPKFIKGDDIIKHFKEKNVGDVDALHGTYMGHLFDIMDTKDPEYVMQLMTTYGTLNSVPGSYTRREYLEDGKNIKVEFQYPEVINNHYRFRHQIDDHNARCHSPIGFEETWSTKWCPNRVMAFLLSVTEVNVKLSHDYFISELQVG